MADNELAVIDEAASIVQGFANGSIAVYSSMKGDDFETKLQVADAITTATPLNLNLDAPFNLVNFVLQAITITDEDGIEQPTVRSILIDDQGNSYATVAQGVVASLQTLTGVLGAPSSWKAPVTVYATEERTRRGFRVMTLKIGAPKKAK